MFVLQSGEGEVADDPECQGLCYRVGGGGDGLCPRVSMFMVPSGEGEMADDPECR